MNMTNQQLVKLFTEHIDMCHMIMDVMYTRSDSKFDE